jgi:purine-binding chemotaxis protein CheW
MNATEPVAGADSLDGQYLTFLLGKEEYAAEILKVQEIRGLTPITTIPNAPPFIRGVMNLRGTVIPVIDLRLRFGVGRAEYDRYSVIVVVRVGDRVTGLLVDSVTDVLDVAKDQIEPPPDLGVAVDLSCLTGVAKTGDRLVILLDIERVLEAAVNLQLPA